MAEVFLCAKNAGLTTSARRALGRAGVVVVEVDDPAQCQFIRSSAPVSGDDMFYAALRALNVKGDYGSKGDLQRERFAEFLLSLVETQRARLQGSEAVAS